MLKTLGYLVSTISVALLGAVAWKSASEDDLMLALLIFGMLLSISGMFLRWLSYRQDQKDKKRIEAQAASRPRAAAPIGEGREHGRAPGLVSARRG